MAQKAASRARGGSNEALLVLGFWRTCWYRNCDHLPLYRQSQIFARAGVELDRSTLAEWVGGSSRLLAPLVEALRRHVMAADKLHADDTPVPVVAPGLGKTKTGRLWTYVRDDRPAGDSTPAAVWFAYSPDRDMVRERKIPYVPNGRRYTIDRLDLDKWIEKSKEGISVAA